MYVYTHTHTNVYAHIRIHIYTHTHTFIHVQHYKQALELYRKLGALGRQAGDNEGIYVDYMIATLLCLGRLYCNWQKGDPFQVFHEALDALRENVRVHGSTIDRQENLAMILDAQGEAYNELYEREPGLDKSKCWVAKVLLEEALAISRSLNLQMGETHDLSTHHRTHRQGQTFCILLTVLTTYVDLEMFDKAQSTAKEALQIGRDIYGNTSEKVAACHSRIAKIYRNQADAIRKSMMQSSSHVLPGIRVRVEGLQNQAQYNGLEGVVLKQEDDSRVCVRLDQDKKQKLENVRMPCATVDERKEMYAQLQDLVHEEVTTSKELLRIQVQVAGVKHFNTAAAYFTLGLVYLQTSKVAETREAVANITKAIRLLRRVVDDDDTLVLTGLKMVKGLKMAQDSLARFEEAGVLSAMPCLLPASSRLEDEKDMERVFASLHDTTGSSSCTLSSEAMQEGLRMYGLFNFTAASFKPVSGRETVALSPAFSCIGDGFLLCSLP